MIRKLIGTVDSVTGDGFVLDVGGVGFGVMAPASTISRLPPAGGRVTIHTQLVVREDSLSLFGFLTDAELRLFSRLLEVTGVGPRVAVAVLSAVSPDDFQRAIVFGDSEYLLGIPGVGRKLAERMVLELKDSYQAERRGRRRPSPAAPSTSPTEEAVSALSALGYSRTEAGQAVADAARVLGDNLTVERLVHEGLRLLGRSD